MYSGDGLAGLLDLPIDDMGEGLFLDHVGALGHAQREIDVRILEVAHAWAVRSQRLPSHCATSPTSGGNASSVSVPTGGEGASETVGEFSPAAWVHGSA